MTDIASEVTAFATAVSAVFIGWQAWLTRKTVEGADRDRVENRNVALDSLRARMDAQAPLVAVRMEEPAFPLRGMAQHGLPTEGNTFRNTTWHFPTGQDTRGYLMAEVVVSNRSQRPVRVEYTGDLLTLDKEGFRISAPVQLVEAGQKHRVTLAQDFSLLELSENFKARQAGLSLPHRVTGTVTVHDDLDAGVTDTWSLDLSGCPLVEDPARESLWLPAPDLLQGDGRRDALEYELLPPRRRTYWASRSEGRELA